MNRNAAPFFVLGRDWAAHHAVASLACATDQSHRLLHGRRKDLRHGRNGRHRRRDRCRADGLGRGLPDPALSARLCAWRGTGLAGTRSRHPWRRSCRCGSPHGQGGCIFTRTCLSEIRAGHRAVGHYRASCRAAGSCPDGGGRRQDTLPLYHSITCVEPQKMARIARDARTRAAGRIAPPDGPGLGITNDQDRLGIPDLILD